MPPKRRGGALRKSPRKDMNVEEALVCPSQESEDPEDVDDCLHEADEKEAVEEAYEMPDEISSAHRKRKSLEGGGVNPKRPKEDILEIEAEEKTVVEEMAFAQNVQKVESEMELGGHLEEKTEGEMQVGEHVEGETFGQSMELMEIEKREKKLEVLKDAEDMDDCLLEADKKEAVEEGYQMPAGMSSSPRKQKPLPGGGVNPKRPKEDILGYIERLSDDGVVSPCPVVAIVQPSTRICVKDLPDNVTVELLKETFSGTENVMILEGDPHGRHALLEWKALEGAEAAMEKQLTCLFGDKKVVLTYVYIKHESDASDDEIRPESNWLRIVPIPVDSDTNKIREIFPTAQRIKISPQSTIHEGSTCKRVVLCFESVEEAKSIMDEYQGKEVWGKNLKVMFALKLADPRPKLFVGNLPWNGSERDLQRIFPGNTKVKIVKCRQNKGLWVSNRYALICFKTLAEVKRFAEEKDGYELKGHSLEVLTKNKEALWPGVKDVMRNESSRRTLVVQGLPRYVTKDDFMKLFPGFVSWKIPNSKDGSLNSNQGVAELEYNTQAEVNKFVTDNQGMMMKGVSLWLCSKMDTLLGKHIGLSNRLSVIGFPPSTTDETLRKAFGGVKSVGRRGSGVIPSHPSELGAVVEFESPELAKAAFDTKQGMLIHGSKVQLYNWGPLSCRVKQFVQPTDPSQRVLLMDLPSEVTVEIIKEAFPECRRAILLRNMVKKSLMAGYVEYSEVERAVKVCEEFKDGVDICGKNIKPEVVLRVRDGTPLEYEVSKLPDTATEEKLLAYFKGAVEAKILGIDQKSYKFGIVKFENTNDAREAYKNRTQVEMDGQHFGFNVRLEEPEMNVHMFEQRNKGARGRGHVNFRGNFDRGGRRPWGRGDFNRGGRGRGNLHDRDQGYGGYDSRGCGVYGRGRAWNYGNDGPDSRMSRGRFGMRGRSMQPRGRAFGPAYGEQYSMEHPARRGSSGERYSGPGRGYNGGGYMKATGRANTYLRATGRASAHMRATGRANVHQSYEMRGRGQAFTQGSFARNQSGGMDGNDAALLCDLVTVLNRMKARQAGRGARGSWTDRY